jgi:hypothetical protein
MCDPAAALQSLQKLMDTEGEGGRGVKKVVSYTLNAISSTINYE